MEKCASCEIVKCASSLPHKELKAPSAELDIDAEVRYDHSRITGVLKQADKWRATSENTGTAYGRRSGFR